MPDRRKHRGPHPEDSRLFASDAWPALRNAVADLSWLLSRSYATPSAMKLVGDRYGLNERQRTAVVRCACSDDALRERSRRRIGPGAVAGGPLLIDGYNVLTTVEAALAGGTLLLARDGCLRDMASIHGTYRKVEETVPALQIVGDFLADTRIKLCIWYLDSPVSNSGRLRALALDLAGQHNWPWRIEVVPDPDANLASSPEIVATADSAVLDRCGRWLNLAREIVRARVPAPVIDLSCSAESGLAPAPGPRGSQSIGT